jgi:hypothetical protein
VSEQSVELEVLGELLEVVHEWGSGSSSGS